MVSGLPHNYQISFFCSYLNFQDYRQQKASFVKSVKLLKEIQCTLLLQMRIERQVFFNFVYTVFCVLLHHYTLLFSNLSARKNQNYCFGTLSVSVHPSLYFELTTGNGVSDLN